MKGYEAIGPYGRKIFDETHIRHLSAMGESERKKYTRDQVKRVKANNDERVIEVYFKNGDLFKYTPKRTWH
ncbi:hypothetical protein SPD48_09660 [Pseudogracilibacillus sp. SE30717A]|uniref:hypothetical protein n=1 Tax=Pseudogracilibacillus sp. SE30717A TaxID=3098293 RepID=UPI00300E34C4